MVEDRRTFELTESIAEAERLFIEDFDTWDMTGYYLYSKLLRAGVSAHIGTGGNALDDIDIGPHLLWDDTSALGAPPVRGKGACSHPFGFDRSC